MKKTTFFARQHKQTTEDPTVFTLFPGSKEEPMTDTVNKIIAILKTKYYKTTFYEESAYEGTHIKIKLNEHGGMIIPITEPTLDCVRKFADDAFKKL